MTIQCPQDKWVISNEEYKLKPVCQAGPRKYADPGFYVILKNEKGIYLDKYELENKFQCKLNTTPIPGTISSFFYSIIYFLRRETT